MLSNRKRKATFDASEQFEQSAVSFAEPVAEKIDIYNNTDIQSINHSCTGFDVDSVGELMQL